VPEKAQPAHNFCIVPRNGDGLGEGGGGAEPVVWTAPDTNPKTAVTDAPTPSAAIREALKRAGVKVLEPSADEFQSEVPQAYRKGEKVYHVKAFRGSKDGKFWPVCQFSIVICHHLLIIYANIMGFSPTNKLFHWGKQIRWDESANQLTLLHNKGSYSSCPKG
jgi:hypothetical protein